MRAHVGLRRPDAVDAVVDDAVEEVDGEERAEEHDLRRDEQVHAEHRGRDARAVVDRRRPVMVVRFGGRAHRLATCGRCGTGEMTCSTGSFVSLAQSLDEVATQPAAALARERRDDDLVDALVVDDLYGRRVRDPDGRPGRARRSPRRAARLRTRAQTTVGVRVLFVVALRGDDQKARRALRGPLPDAIEQLVGDDGLVCDHEDVRLALRRDRPRRRRAAPGALRRALDLLDDVPPHPARSAPRRGSRRRSRRLSARAAPARP